METHTTHKRLRRVKLIFNPGAGANDKSPVQLMDVIKEMQSWNLVPEPFLIEPDCDLSKVVKDAISNGIKMVVVCGGDGTVSSVARAVLGTSATLGIIPVGTRNNIALSLGIPTDIPSAIAILGSGRRIKIDMGISTCGDVSTPFIELCSIGLFSTLFSAGDDIQHGNLARIGDFLSTLSSTPPSEIHLFLDNKQEIQKSGHIVLVTNMPYVGINYQVGPPKAFKDGLLDVLFFAELSKIDLMSYVLKGPGTSKQEDPRIQHFRVLKATIDTHPDMPIMADGIDIGGGSVQIEVLPRALTLMAPSAVSKALTNLVKSMKNKEINPSEEVRIPELEIHGVSKKIINWISHIPHIFWIMSIIFFLVMLLILVPFNIWQDFWSSLKEQGILVSLVLIFTLVAVSLVWSVGQRIDVWIFMYFNMHGRRTAWVDWMMLGFTQIGNFIFALGVAAILLVYGHHLLAFELIFGLLTLGLLIQIIKVLIHRTRPYIKLKNIRIVGSRASGRSFPSGHTGQAFFLATLLLQYFQVNLYVCLGLYAIALLVGITRIYVGMHYPRDVLGGAILGTAWGLLGVIVNSRIFS